MASFKILHLNNLYTDLSSLNVPQWLCPLLCVLHVKMSIKRQLLLENYTHVEGLYSCRCVSVSVQKYSVQYKGYNLVRVIAVERGVTRGTTALVYWQINNSLYTGAVQVLCSVVEYTPAGLTVSRGVASSTHWYEKPQDFHYILNRSSQEI